MNTLIKKIYLPDMLYNSAPWLTLICGALVSFSANLVIMASGLACTAYGIWAIVKRKNQATRFC